MYNLKIVYFRGSKIYLHLLTSLALDQNQIEVQLFSRIKDIFIPLKIISF